MKALRLAGMRPTKRHILFCFAFPTSLPAVVPKISQITQLPGALDALEETYGAVVQLACLRNCPIGALPEVWLRARAALSQMTLPHSLINFDVDRKLFAFGFGALRFIVLFCVPFRTNMPTRVSGKCRTHAGQCIHSGLLVAGTAWGDLQTLALICRVLISLWRTERLPIVFDSYVYPEDCWGTAPACIR